MPNIKKITVAEGQNLYDLALQEYGSIESVIDLINDNSSIISGINDRLNSGQELNIDTDKIVNRNVVNYYKRIKENYNPATGDEPTAGEFSDDFNDDFLI